MGGRGRVHFRPDAVGACQFDGYDIRGNSVDVASVVSSLQRDRVSLVFDVRAIEGIGGRGGVRYWLNCASWLEKGRGRDWCLGD